MNAVEMPRNNALNFPAAILQAPIFDPVAPGAVNYGGSFYRRATVLDGSWAELGGEGPGRFVVAPDPD